MQAALLERLVAQGAEPATGLGAALAHGELDAARKLIELGAPIDLVAAACLGHDAQVNALLSEADDTASQRALALAARNGQQRSVEVLLDHGVDPDRYNPEGAHAHATPLHNAVSAGHLGVVEALIARGADLLIKDKLFGGDAHDWAEHCIQPEIAAYLKQAREGGAD